LANWVFGKRQVLGIRRDFWRLRETKRWRAEAKRAETRSSSILLGRILENTHAFHRDQRSSDNHLVENRQQTIDVRLIVDDLDNHEQ